MDWQTIGAFVAATAVLLVTPGPIMAIIAGNTLRGGQMEGFWTVLGIGLGEAMLLGMTLVSILASNALIPSLFPWVSLAGATYLAWLCFDTWRQAPSQDADHVRSRRPFFEGWVIALCNPTALLFQFAFFMQFIDRTNSVAMQALFLAAAYFVASIAFDLGCVFFAARARSAGVLTASRQRLARLACTFVYFGTSIAAFSAFLAPPQ